jgi:hypothetical protein
VQAKGKRRRLREDSALRRLDDLVASCLPALARPGDGPPGYLPPTRPITPGEARAFFRAVDTGLFEVADNGMCRPRKMRPGTGYCYPLLSRPLRKVNKVRLWREWLTHASAPAVLHLDYRYPLHDIALDVDAFDVLVYSPLNQPLVAVEVKKTAAELDGLVDRMRVLEKQAFELRFRPRLSNAEQKFRSLLALRPSYFLAIAPDHTRAFEVIHPDDRTYATAELREIEGIPRSQP